MARDQKVVFTNGCFDLIHVGHIRLLEQASLLGDVLIVGLNSDRSAEKAKGCKPIIPQDQRAEVLAALWSVDEVILFDESTPLELIKEIRPNILVKGSDYNPENVVGAEYAEKVLCLDVGTKVHTSKILRKIVKAG